MFRCGQHISTQYSLTRSLIQDYSLILNDNDDNSDNGGGGDWLEVKRNELWVLAERLRNSAPISPQNAIQMTASSGLSTAGVILTYLVVLIQFKIGEKKKGGCFSSAGNTTDPSPLDLVDE